MTRRAAFTPEATIGPFYPGVFLNDMPQDLSAIAPLVAHRPHGQPIAVTLRFLDAQKQPVPSLLVEFWQANARGRYRHPADDSPAPLDPQFDGFARLRTADDGTMRLCTIKPGAHPGFGRGETQVRRAPHLRLTIFASGIDRLATQLFFDDEPLNAADPILNLVPDPQVRRRLIARRDPQGRQDGHIEYTIDIVLRGEGETPFFDSEVERIEVVANDRESESRTPQERMYRIPEGARDPFTACPPQPFVVRAGENDLTRIGPGRPPAHGQPIAITGRILDEDLRPVPRTLVEIWNANAHGRYSHSIDAGRNDAPLDPHFYGFGRLLTDDDGRYRLKTIKPGAYIARKDIAWWRPPHVHFSVVGAGIRLVTQMYFPDEPLNEKDFIYLIVPERDRPRLLGRPIGPRDDELTFEFDIVIRGRFQSPPDLD